MRKGRIIAIAATLVLSISFSIRGYSEQQTNKEEIVLTTYYPTPYGDYREMRAERMAVGKDWRSAANVCWEGGKCSNPDIAPDTNLVVEGNVGIGSTYKPQTVVPNSKPGNLDVNDVYLRSAEAWVSQRGVDFFQTNFPGGADFIPDALVTSWYDVPSASVNLTKGKYLVFFITSAYDGCWVCGRGEFYYVRLKWSAGVTGAQALAGTEQAQQVNAETVLVEVITLEEDDTIQAQWSNYWGSRVPQFYHPHFVIAKLP